MQQGSAFSIMKYLVKMDFGLKITYINLHLWTVQGVEALKRKTLSDINYFIYCHAHRYAMHFSAIHCGETQLNPFITKCVSCVSALHYHLFSMTAQCIKGTTECCIEIKKSSGAFFFILWCVCSSFK